MQKKEPIQISSLGEFIGWVKQLDFKKCLFRGVPNAEYRIQASAYRRPKEENRNLEKFLQINKHLIADARLRGHGERDGRELGDLEILAQLQHFGAATCLIDFTHNAQVALYFACQKDSKWEKNQRDSENPPDGKVYAVPNDPLNFKKVTPDLLKEKISYFLPRSQPYGRDRQLYHWEPGYQNNRIIAQQSVFVFGAPEIDENEACIIEEECKKDILIELEQVSGINEAMLFPDFDGFSRLHREDTLYEELGASDYFRRAERAHSETQYEEAILNYDKAIELDPQDSETYLWRALAKRALGQNRDAIDDLDKMVKINSNPHAFEMQGKVLSHMKEDRKAIAAFDKVIELDPDNPSCYIRRAIAKWNLRQYQETINDIDQHLQIEPDDFYAYRLRGKVNEDLGNLDEAKRDFQKALRFLSPNARSIGEIKSNIQRIEKRIVEKN